MSVFVSAEFGLVYTMGFGWVYMFLDCADWTGFIIRTYFIPTINILFNVSWLGS